MESSETKDPVYIRDTLAEALQTVGSIPQVLFSLNFPPDHLYLDGPRMHGGHFLDTLWNTRLQRGNIHL